MSLEDLPVLASITALYLGHTVLHLEDGSSVTIDTHISGCWAACGPEFLAVNMDGESKAYAVPVALQPSLQAALRLSNAQRPPPVLTLLSISKQANTVTFGASNGEGQPVSLTMPRPIDVRPGFPMPRPVGVPVNLSVTREATPPGHGFTFKVYPETQEGRAVLELLNLAAQVEASGEGQA